MNVRVQREQTTVVATFIVTWDDDDPLPEPVVGAGGLYPEVVRVEVARNAMGENRWHVHSVDVRGKYALKRGGRGSGHNHYYGGSRVAEAPGFAQDAIRDLVSSLS